MKKKILMSIGLLMVCGGLTGCGTSEEDLEYAKNPEKFVKESFEEEYNKDIELVSKDEKTDNNGNVTTIMKYKLKDDQNVVFDTCAYWDADLFGNRNYIYTSNYKNVYEINLIKEYFDNNEHYTLNFSSKKIQETGFCSYDRIDATLEILDYSYISEVKSILLEMQDNSELYAFYINLKINDKESAMTTNKDTTEEQIDAFLSKLQ